MLSPPEHERGDHAARKIFEPPADEREPRGRQIDDRGEVELPCKPRLHDVLIRRLDVREVVREKRSDMPRDELVLEIGPAQRHRDEQRERGCKRKRRAGGDP